MASGLRPKNELLLLGTEIYYTKKKRPLDPDGDWRLETVSVHEQKRIK